MHRINRAAVLVPLFFNQEDNEIHVLLTIRSKNLNSYPGQVAFPGGRQDSTDETILMTALREAREEIGLLSNDVHVIAALTPVLSRSNLLVTPIIGIIPNDYQPVMNLDEVEACFHVPLRIFIEGSDLYHRYEDIQFNKTVFRLHHFDHHGHDMLSF